MAVMMVIEISCKGQCEKLSHFLDLVSHTDLAFNLQKMSQVHTTSWNWWESSQTFNIYINFSEILPMYVLL